MNTQKVVINTCFGGFGLSTAAYERLIDLGVPVQKYIEQNRNEETGLYEKEPRNDGEVIFDRELTPPGENTFNDLYYEFKGSGGRMATSRYWDSWTRENRTHPLVIQVVEELGEKADGGFAQLKVVEIPAGVEWEISDYDGRESVEEVHQSWG